MGVFDCLRSGMYYIGMTLVYILALLMAYGAIVVLLSLFWKGEVGRDMRKSCLVYIILLIVPFIVIWIKPKEKKENKSGLYQTQKKVDDGRVYICTGKSSHAYHSTDECYGIQACTGDIEKVSLEDAVYMGRTPCHYCHNEDDEEESDREEEYDPDRDESGVYIIDGDTIRMWDDYR